MKQQRFTAHCLIVTLLIVLQPLSNKLFAQKCDKSRWGMPDQSIDNRFLPNGYRYGYPITMFNKNEQGWTLEWALKTIRGRIKEGFDHSKDTFNTLSPEGKTARMYFLLYKSIYIHASKAKPKPHKDTDDDGVDVVSYWTKNNAFVRLIGLEVKDSLYRYLSTEELAQKVTNCEIGFNHMDYELDNFKNADIKYRSKELIMYLQAYDLLKGAKVYMQDDDGNSPCSIRGRLRQYMFFYSKKVDGPLRVINHLTGHKKNFGLMAAGALGLGAVVLNDAGAKRYILNKHWTPRYWSEYAKEGIEENLFAGKHFGTPDVPQSARGDLTGYAEGTNYFNYAFENLIPFFRASSNFASPGSGDDYLSWNQRAEIMRLLSWADQLQTAGGTLPEIDNTALKTPAITGATGLKEFHTNNTDLLSNADVETMHHIYMGADFMASLAEYSSLNSTNTPITIMQDAGSAILRQADSRKNEHYFHFLFEDGHSIDKAASNVDGTHEDDDFGSFSIKVNEVNLAIDPPYKGWGNEDKTNKYDDHNTIRLLASNNESFDGHLSLQHITNFGDKGLQLKYSVWNENPSLPAIAIIYRSVGAYQTAGQFYWMLNDEIDSEDESVARIRWQLNGLGEPPGTYSYANRESRWEKYCETAAMFSHSAFLNGESDIVTPYPKHEATGNNATVSEDGTHTRIEYFQDRRNTLIQTIIMHYQCSGDSILPSITRRENNEEYVSTTLRFFMKVDTTFKFGKNTGSSPSLITDSVYDFHLARLTTGTSNVADPFDRGEFFDTLSCNAKHVFLRMNTYTKSTTGFCTPTFIKIKSASISNGTFLEFQDTMYIEAAQQMASVEYKYDGKFQYKGYVSGTGTVVLYMPDMEYGFPMKASGQVAMSYTHNSTGDYKFISVYFNGSGEFVLELEDPCTGDCYFPPTAVTVDTLFNFDIGTLKPLDHDLDIVSGDGHLRITEMSRLSICPDNVLVNKDSITMYIPCAPEQRWLVNEDGSKVWLEADTLKYICDRKLLLKDRAVNETRNTIIVNDRAALVLDNGSVTHIGNGSTILIRTGGTLLVKAGATVIIGDRDCVNNRGELLADQGSYICIEEGANMFFYNEIDSVNFYYKDTLDRHIVYIAMPDSNGSGGAIAGKNPSGGRGKFEESGVWSEGQCVSFCELITHNPLYGVNNRPFGWFNIGLPRALYFSADTLCIGKSFSIDATPSLNETSYSIMVCKYDTTSQTCSTSVLNITEAGDFCLGKRYLFTPTEAGYNKVRLIVENDCHLTDTFFKIVYVPHLPVASFSVPDSICPGIGTLHANGSLSRSNINKCEHRWTIEPIIEDTTDIEKVLSLNGTGQSWFIDTLTSVSSDFTFPGYNFIGGMQYEVSLTVKGWCSDSIYSMIVSVPLRVSINLEQAISYENPIGPTPVRLIGTVLNAQSWSWSPTDYLDSALSLTPVATPAEPITYVLTGTLNGCSITDTVFVNYHKMANAGDDRALCINESTVMGSDFNAAIFLGSFNYSGSGSFAGLYSTYYAYDLDFHKYFTTFMIKVQKNVYGNNDNVTNFSNLSEYMAKVFSRPWFNEFYSAFVTNEANQASLNMFRDYISEDDELMELLQLPWHSEMMEDLFEGYKSYITSNQFEATQIIWERQDTLNGSWSQLTEWEDYFNIYVTPNATKQYRITAMDDDLGVIEYDEVLLSADSVILPSFDVYFQEDSTVYFVDETLPYSNYYSYQWVFGDGDSSTSQNPVHTFTAFDSAYLVCLSITNSCGTYQYCDTVFVDSSSNGYSKTDHSQESRVTVNDIVKKQKTAIDHNRGETKLDNIPNPFTGETIISYSIHPGFSKATLRITDVLGRTIKEIPVYSSNGKVPFEVGLQSAGIYYVSLISDGIVVKSKTMMVER